MGSIWFSNPNIVVQSAIVHVYLWLSNYTFTCLGVGLDKLGILSLHLNNLIIDCPNSLGWSNIAYGKGEALQIICCDHITYEKVFNTVSLYTIV